MNNSNNDDNMVPAFFIICKYGGIIGQKHLHSSFLKMVL